ncbi:olfactory receptor 11A1-like [Boleophthalmus pectinirostris]|uniref:olfactory receptor 11A1-like n=1 Tax=Boleophthalmus pectinirostris TaxID=150288 RepID=UPI000A1C73AE|nr:olfactory receptor 11A1-like [Boleophthalmus pectinirostris]
MNYTPVIHFVLGAYIDIGPLKYLSFVVLLLMYCAIILFNIVLIVVICLNRNLHEPMFIFLCSLLFNELYGSAAIFPLLLVQIFQDVHVVSYTLCLLQIFILYSYGGIEFATLAVMSYDRYLAICHPLQYASRMTPNKIAGLTALTWCYPIMMNLFITYALTAPLTLCGNVIHKVYCDNYWVVRLSCFDTRLNNVFGLTHMFSVILSLILLIIYTYIRILRVCFNGSRQTRQKALSTCTPHLLSIINFSFGAFFEIVQSRFNMQAVPNPVRVFLSLYWLTVQPLANPLVYGLKMTKIRLVLRALLFGK